ncbi:MAG: hypothetical protein KO253_04505 [Methanobrevibacter arboriphilus]|nr:hypothetical protein [Methanobrevibacter arboriphilus]
MTDFYDLNNSIGQFVEMMNNELIELNKLKKEEIKQLKLANELKKKEITLKCVELSILNGDELINLEEIGEQIDYNISVFERKLGFKQGELKKWLS